MANEINNKHMKHKLLFITIFVFFTVAIKAQVMLSCDFTNAENKKAPIRDFWSIDNKINYKRTSDPALGKNVKLNTIRILGGVKKAGENKDFEYDPYKFDSISNQYYYDWKVLLDRIDFVLASFPIHQFVIDNVPWRFQDGYTFVEKRDGVNFLKSTEVEQYGNALPPYSAKNWHRFIVALMDTLKSTYGESVVESWRFRIGTEIETPGHWAGSKMDFFNHYKNTVDAVHSVLPKAKVGPHFREANFVYKEGQEQHFDYEGNQIKSFGREFVQWAADNNIHYDFAGTSYYPEYSVYKGTPFTSTNMERFYNVGIAPIYEHPAWNPNATFDIFEYSLHTKSSLVHEVHSSHNAAFYASLAKMVYEYNLGNVHNWGTKIHDIISPSAVTMKALYTMLGKSRYQSTKEGNSMVLGNNIDAIFAKDDDEDKFDVLVYNFNGDSMDYNIDEKVTVAFHTNLPTNTTLFYRDATYSKNECAYQNWLNSKPDTATWIKDGFDPFTRPPFGLTPDGQNSWNATSGQFVKYNDLQWSDWKTITTSDTTAGNGSVAKIDIMLASFSFQKIEIRVKPQDLSGKKGEE